MNSNKEGGETMRKLLLSAVVLLFLFSMGCASKDYVRQQMDPLVDRISKLEAKVANVESKLAALERLGNDVETAKKNAAAAKALAQDGV